MWAALRSHEEIRNFLIPQLQRFDDTFNVRVFPPFADAESNAKRLQQQYWHERMGGPDAKDRDAASVIAAHEQSEDIWYEELAVRFVVVNLFTAGVYHLFEQHMGSLYRGWTNDTARSPVQAARDWLARELRIDIGVAPQWSRLEELRLVANVVKHAEGDSAERLRQVNPDLFRLPGGWDVPVSLGGRHRPVGAPLTGEDLYITKDYYDRYVRSILDFWEWLADQVEAKGFR